jgi:hypothetical protein
MLDGPHHGLGSTVQVDTPEGERRGVVVEVPFPGAVQR